MAMILIIPLWKRGMEGDFKNKCFLMIYKISPHPSLLKRGRKNRNDPLDYAKSRYFKYLIFGIFNLISGRKNACP